ncbi:C1orf101 [Branchiostoma lanceolatum]|nr:C1orf101 [Branchiostoma lanceolatum]
MSDLQWKVEPACHVTPQGLHGASIRCSSPGMYVVYPDVAGAGASDDNTLHVQVLDSPSCYRWYLIPANRTADVPDKSGETWLLHVWIVDDRHASLSELNNTAQEPSEYSAQLTELSWRKKQHPEVRQLYSSHVQHVLSKGTAYSRNSSLWEVVVEVDNSAEQALLVSGRPVMLDNCFVGDTQVLLHQAQFSDSSVSSSVSLKGSTAVPVLVQSPVSSGVALLISSTEVLLTQDSFLTTEKLIIPDDVLQSCNGEVQGAAFTASSLYVIACNSLCRMAQNGTWERVIVQGVSGGLVGLKARERHSRVGRAQVDDECLAVWTSTQLFLKSSRESSLELTSLPTKQLGASGYSNNSVPILDVSFPSDPEELGVLVQVLTAEGDNKVMTLQYDLPTTIWSLPEFIMQHSSAGNFSLLYLASAMPEALVWDPSNVTYSFSNGTGTLQVLKGNMTSNLVESIQEIIAGPNGDFVIHLTSNKLYYGRVDMENVVELSPGELPEAEVVLFFDVLGRLHLVNYDSTASLATARLFPLQAEVYSSMYPATSCPYHRFSHGIDVDGYYIDVGEELKIWASLLYPSGSYNSVEVLVRNGHLLQQNFSSEIHPSSLYTTENMTLHFSSNVTFDMLQAENSESSYGTTGIVTVEVRPKQTSYACRGPVNMVTSISVGCPPNRLIRVRRPSGTEECSSYQNYIYTLSPDMYDPTYKGEGCQGCAENSTEVTYDLDNLACPIDVFYSDHFRPTVDLYDGEQFVREVTEDYFVWEAHGRTGYGYNATMQQAGCACQAQTLAAMLTAGNVSTPGDAWGPQNYQPCSTPCDPPGSLLGQHEVLSSSGVSALKFGSSKGIFVFHLKVLDPECSYCVLQTQFAVRVYGSPRESLDLYVYLAVLAFIVGTVIVLALTYYMYYKLMAGEHEKVLQEWTNKESEEQEGKESEEEEVKEEEK